MTVPRRAAHEIRGRLTFLHMSLSRVAEETAWILANSVDLGGHISRMNRIANQDREIVTELIGGLDAGSVRTLDYQGVRPDA